MVLLFRRPFVQELSWATVATIHIGPGGKKGAVPLSRIAVTPFNTVWPGPRSTSVASGVFIHPAIWPQTWAKNWVCVGVPFFWGYSCRVPREHKVAWAEAYLHTKWHLISPSSRLATTDIGRKLGAVSI